MRTTALYDDHMARGARMTEFANWRVPLSFGSILDEARAVRRGAGIFDVSHMGRIEVSGLTAVDLLQRLTTNDVASLAAGRGHYNLMCNADGGIIDDLTIFRTADYTYLLVVNAINTEMDVDWITSRAPESSSITEITDATSLFALQGPTAREIIVTVSGATAPDLSRFGCAPVDIAGASCFISRTGYTGEDGYEIACDADDSIRVWQALLAAGGPIGVIPCGLGARDVLRIEAGYVLYGNEINEEISPVQAGLARFVRMDKGDYIGREPLARILETGPAQSLTGIRMFDKTVPRAGSPIYAEETEIGLVTSGTYSPSLELGVGLGYVQTERNSRGLEVTVGMRGKSHYGILARTPFYG
jgi:aminomethyltransferase